MTAEQFTRQADDQVALPVYRWRPEGSTPIRAVVLIAHGLSEHGQRYAETARALNASGYLVDAIDHRGHGQLAGSDETRGFFAPEDGWGRVIRDLRHHVDALRSEFPELPLFFLGHSMGSMLLQQYLYTHGETIDGAILSGSAGKPPPLAHIGRVIARLERRRQGPLGRSKLIDNLAFGKFNKSFGKTRTDFDWLSRDPDQVDAYIEDPLCGFLASNQLWVDLLDAYCELARPENQARVPKGLPIYIFAGSLDPVGENTKSLKQLLGAYERAGLTHVTHRFYEAGRHEMLNESNREEVRRDLLTWLDARLEEFEQK